MTLLSGWGPILLAAGLTVPPLVALYFLKLRRMPKPISSTLLWKRAVEDLQVNAPFQRIRNNLLLWLQLLVLLLAAFALGKPMIEAKQEQNDTLILLIDNSASMAVAEEGRKTRLDVAKEQAKTTIDNMPDGSRIMVITFCDRAGIVSPFETDKDDIKTRIDQIEQTDSTTTLSEAMRLAEAYLQNLIIAGSEPGKDFGPGMESGAGGFLAVPSTASPARVVIFSDSNVQDAKNLVVQRLPADEMEVVSIGERSDNVGILSMDARRNYERPDALETFAMVRNFSETKVELDAHLYINDEHVDVQTMVLQPGRIPGSSDDDQDTGNTNAGTSGLGAPTLSGDGNIQGPLPGSIASVAFDEIDYEGGGVVEVRLSIDDALECDNRAWTIIQPPRNVSVLFVTNGNMFLERLLPALPIALDEMTPSEYESAAEEKLTELGRSRYDLVIVEGHNTDRLFPGNYFFLGCVPLIEGISIGDEPITNEVIFNWDESHPLLRHVAIETIQLYQWLDLTLPPQAETLIEGESGPIMALLAHESSQFLISAFGILTVDDVTGSPMLNTNWVTKAHFPVFIFNMVQYLSGALTTAGVENTMPGEPIELQVPKDYETVRVHRPGGQVDKVPTAGFTTVNYARTRNVGIYRSEPGVEGRNQRAVNLFSSTESDIAPSPSLELGGDKVQVVDAVKRVNKPFWPWILLAILAVMTIEWAIYSKRVYV